MVILYLTTSIRKVISYILQPSHLFYSLFYTSFYFLPYSSFEYGEWATILKGQFLVFPQPQGTFQGLDSQKRFFINYKFPRASIFVSIELGLFLGIFNTFFDQFQSILHINNHFI